MNRLPADRAASQTALLTTEKAFMSMSSGGKNLLQVMPGIPAINALEQVSCILAMAESVLSGLLSLKSESEEGDFAPLFLIESAGAIVDSVVSGMGHASRLNAVAAVPADSEEDTQFEALALRFPISSAPFDVWYNDTAAEEGSADCWAVNDANGDAIFDLPSLLSAQHVAEKLKRLGGTVKAMKGGVR